jgi:hypothetical protein
MPVLIPMHSSEGWQSNDSTQFVMCSRVYGITELSEETSSFWQAFGKQMKNRPSI